MTAHPEIVELPSSDALAGEAAHRFVEAARAAIGDHGEFYVALSGGSTPRAMYEKLAVSPTRAEVEWEKVHVFFSDERFVPPDSPESNFHTANEELLTRVPIPPDHVHAYKTVGLDPDPAAAAYEQEVRRVLRASDTDIPSFDLIFLGMGPDGHTASLFPGTEALTVTDRLVVANFVPKVNMWRLTFTYPLLNAGRTVMFLVQGDDKKQRVREILGGSSDLPAAGVQPSPGHAVWLLDPSAASEYNAAVAARPDQSSP